MDFSWCLGSLLFKELSLSNHLFNSISVINSVGAPVSETLFKSFNFFFFQHSQPCYVGPDGAHCLSSARRLSARHHTQPLGNSSPPFWWRRRLAVCHWNTEGRCRNLPIQLSHFTNRHWILEELSFLHLVTYDIKSKCRTGVFGTQVSASLCFFNSLQRATALPCHSAGLESTE